MKGRTDLWVLLAAALTAVSCTDHWYDRHGTLVSGGAGPGVVDGGACHTLIAPAVSRCYEVADSAPLQRLCAVGDDGEVRALDARNGVKTIPNGCVGLLLAFDRDLGIDVSAAQAAFSVFVAPYSLGKTNPCCSEASATNRVAHVMSLGPGPRALFLTLGGPVVGPTQVAVHADLHTLFPGEQSLMGGGVGARFYVGAEP